MTKGSNRANRTVKRFERSLPALETELRGLVRRAYGTAERIHKARRAAEAPAAYGRRKHKGDVAGGGA